MTADLADSGMLQMIHLAEAIQYEPPNITGVGQQSSDSIPGVAQNHSGFLSPLDSTQDTISWKAFALP